MKGKGDRKMSPSAALAAAPVTSGNASEAWVFPMRFSFEPLSLPPGLPQQPIDHWLQRFRREGLGHDGIDRAAMRQAFGGRATRRQQYDAWHVSGECAPSLRNVQERSVAIAVVGAAIEDDDTRFQFGQGL